MYQAQIFGCIDNVMDLIISFISIITLLHYYINYYTMISINLVTQESTYIGIWYFFSSSG